MGGQHSRIALSCWVFSALDECFHLNICSLREGVKKSGNFPPSHVVRSKNNDILHFEVYKYKTECFVNDTCQF